MGYYYYFHDADLHIDADRMEEAELLMREYKKSIKASDYASETDTRPAIVQVAESNRWSTSMNHDGGATINHPYEKIKGDDNTDWLKALAPVIRDGGFVQIMNDDAYVYRYMFQCGKCYQVSPIWSINASDKEETSIHQS